MKNRIIALFFTLISILSYSSCGGTKACGLDEFINKLSSDGNLQDYEYDINKLNPSKEMSQNCLVYCLNSQCSVCIMEYLSFMELYVNNKCTFPLYVLVCQNDSSTVDYYINEIPQLSGKCRIIVNNNIISDDVSPDDYNGVVLNFNNNSIKAAYHFIE